MENLAFSNHPTMASNHVCKYIYVYISEVVKSFKQSPYYTAGALLGAAVCGDWVYIWGAPVPYCPLWKVS